MIENRVCKKDERVDLKLLHGGQILTNRKTIIQYIHDNEMPITFNTVYLIAEYLKGCKHDLRLYSVCSRLYFLSRLVYKGKKGVCKLLAENYQKSLFGPHAENLDEICDVLVSVDRDYLERNVEKGLDYFETLQRCFDLIKVIWSKNLACINEQIYIPELAYAFEYVTERKGKLPLPEFQERIELFPKNYINYNYTEGIAKHFEEEMTSIF